MIHKSITKIFKILIFSIIIFTLMTYINITSLANLSENSINSKSISLASGFSESTPTFNIPTNNLLIQLNNYTPIKINQLTNEELIEYSSLEYSDRLDFLFNESYYLEDRIKVFLGDDLDNIGLIYYDFNSDEKISINEDFEFTAASTYKVGLNLLFYYLESIGEINLNDCITYWSSDYEEGTGILCGQSYIGSRSIQELLDLSIIYSDNIATNMLGRHLGGHSQVRKKLYEILDIDFSNKGNIITPNIEFTILKYIYDNKENENFIHLIDVLTETEFNDRMDKYIDTSIVAHKIGTYGNYIHDVGIILDDTPYILIIYTNCVDDADEKIAQISKAIFETR